jgi:actin-related protein
MFLGPLADQHIRRVRQAHSRSFTLVERLNELANRSLFDANIDPTDAQEFVLAALLPRALTTFQSAVILSERGLEQEAQVALRTLLEVTFKARAIAMDRKFAEDYIRANVVHRENFLKKFKRLTQTEERVMAQQSNQTLLDEISQRIKAGKNRDLTVEEYAKAAGLIDFYYSAYTVLSQHVHVNVGTLDRYLDIDVDGNLVGMKYGFDDKELDHILLTAAEALILTLEATSTVLLVPEVDKLRAIHNEFTVLHSDLFDET